MKCAHAYQSSTHLLQLTGDGRSICQPSSSAGKICTKGSVVAGSSSYCHPIRAASMCTSYGAAQPKNKNRTTTIIYQEWIESTSYNSAWPLMSNADYAVSTLVAICAHETEKGREPELIDQESKSMRGAAQCSKTKRHNSQLSASVLPPRTTLFFPSCWHCVLSVC